jgi:hypothetical protein
MSSSQGLTGRQENKKRQVSDFREEEMHAALLPFLRTFFSFGVT